MTLNAGSVIARLHRASNDHDLDAFVACFDPAYQSEQPVHPNRVFKGNQQVRTNWAALFASVQDFQADLVSMTVNDSTVWSEWVWTGHHASGDVFDVRGVTIMGIEHDRIVWARLYMEETEQDSADIDATVRHLTRTPPPSMGASRTD